MTAVDVPGRSDTLTSTPPPPGPPTAPASRGFRPDIEGIRAVAVVIVVLYHAGVPQLPGGYVGVDVFLVISGFLITRHLLAAFSGPTVVPLRRFVADFYARRVRRLLPLASLVIVVTTVSTWFLVSALQARDVADDAIWAALFAMNVHLARIGVDYQANQDPSPLQHFWSLAVEEQFYLFWPVLLLLAVTALRRIGLPLRAAAGVTCAALVGGSLLYAVRLTVEEPSQAYFSTAARAWELGAGAMIAVAGPLAAALMVRLGPVLSTLMAAAGVAMVGVAAATFTDATPFPGLAAVLPVGGTAMIILAGSARATVVESFLLARSPVQAVGRLSYAWYLWHWPVLVIAPMYLQRPLRLVEALALAGIALWMAMCSAIAVETPLRTYPALVRSPARSLRWGALLIAGTVLCAVGVGLGAPRLLGLDTAAVAISAAELPAAVIAGQDVQVVPANLTPDLVDARTDKPDLAAGDGGSCMVGLLSVDLSTETGGTCVAGGTEGGHPTVVLAGDSHAYQWVPALRAIAVDRGWRLVSMTKSGCPLYDVEMLNTQLKRRYDECTEWREKVRARIETEKPAMVITSAGVFSERDDDFTQSWIEGVDRTVRGLTAAGIPTVVIADIPYPRRNVPECVTRNVTAVADSCSLPVEDALSDPARRTGTTTAARAAGATVIDPQPWFCGPVRCPVIVGQYLVYSDNNHMSASYSRLLAPLLADRLPPL